MKVLSKISGVLLIPLIAIVVILSGLDSGNSSVQYKHSAGWTVIDGEIIVMLKAGVNANSLSAGDISFSNVQLSKEPNLWLLRYDYSEVDSPSDVLYSLRSNDNVISAQFNHTVSLRENAPDDPRFNEQWGLNNTGQGGGTPSADIKALKAWDISTGGKTKDGRDVIIAVIDNGFYLQHSDLLFWKNLREIPYNQIDDDENGYVDDYNGWNAVQDNDSIVPLDHGTRVCGVIGAKGNNSSGIAGVNWKVQLMPVQILATPEISEATVLKAYAYVLKQRQLYNQTNGANGSYIVAANTSFGIDFARPEDHPLWCEFFELMGKEGILNVAATMNNNSNVDITGDVPTACPSDYLITVTSTTRDDELHNGSAYGPISIDIGAPGVSILSTTLANQYSMAGGTSLASPHVAGTVGLLYAAAHQSYIDYGLVHPDSLALIFKKFILDGSDKRPSLNGMVVSDGRLNLFNSVNRVDRPMGSENQHIPISYNLSQNYPNPFNPTTNITYDILDAVDVRIIVYNTLGQKVATPVNSFHTKGRYSFQFDASSLSAGVYFYRIQSKYYSDIKKMILLN